jgi:hypothetical protein
LKNGLPGGLRRTALIAIAVFVIAIWACATSIYFPAYALQSAEHRNRECRVAVDVALDMMNRRTHRQDGLPRLLLEFSPELKGISPEGLRAALPGFVPAGWREHVLAPRAIDCRNAFVESHIPVVGNAKELDAELTFRNHLAMISFSRIVFSGDDKYAYFENDGACGALCGSGFDTRYRLQGGRWVFDKAQTLWIS